MSVYYNENEPYAAAWLRNLIDAGHLPAGDVDERSIVDVRPDDLRGYVQCHFFAGIGGWPLALRMAGWPDARPVWTGSCPCQTISSAARGRNVASDLWPSFHDLIAAIRPREVFGEQVAHSRSWVDRLCDDMEHLDYEIGAAILPAVSIGQDHVRYRFYFVGHTDRYGKSELQVNGEMAGLREYRSERGGVVQTHGLSNRVAQFSAFGNAIVPQVAAQFILAARDVIG